MAAEKDLTVRGFAARAGRFSRRSFHDCGVAAGVQNLRSTLIENWTARRGSTSATPPAPATITVSPATTQLDAIGATAQLSAEVRDQNGAVMGGAPVSWSSGHAAVARVDGSAEPGLEALFSCGLPGRPYRRP